jgi:CDP-glucose 4,6-dehydratase
VGNRRSPLDKHLNLFGDIYRGKKVLITGHTGFKGSWLSLWLKQLGAHVHGLSEYIPSSPSHYELIKKSQFNPFESDLRIDVRNYEAIKQAIDVIKPDVLFHLAARPIVKDCIENPKRAFDVNLGGTVNLLTALRESPSVQAAVFITSDKCYENVEWEYGYRESDRLGGKDPYSASKACAEIAISSYHRTFFANSNTRIASGRAGNVIGGGDWADFRIIPDCVKAWSSNSSLTIRSPRSTRPWEHVLEPLSGYLLLGERLLNKDSSVIGESFNFGPEGTEASTVLETIEEMARYWESPQWNVPNSHLSANEAVLLKLCCDKASNRLKWKATLSYKETIEMTSTWYKNYYLNNDIDPIKLSMQQIETYCQKAWKEKDLLWTRS